MDVTALGTAGVIAVLLVPVVSRLKNKNWSSEVKHAFSMVAAIVAAFIAALIDGHVNSVKEALPLFFSSFTSSNVVYTQFFSRTNLNERLTES